MVRLLAALIQPYMPSMTARIMQQMALPLSAADLNEAMVTGERSLVLDSLESVCAVYFI